MTREPTKREKGLMDMRTALANAARAVDMDWPVTMLDNPMVSADQDVLCRAYRYDMSKLQQAAQIVDTILINADGFGLMFELAAKKPMEFQALAVWAKIELDRPAPAEQAAEA